MFVVVLCAKLKISEDPGSLKSSTLLAPFQPVSEKKAKQYGSVRGKKVGDWMVCACVFKMRKAPICRKKMHSDDLVVTCDYVSAAEVCVTIRSTFTAAYGFDMT